MPLLVQADLDRKLRIWFYRLIGIEPTPSGKSVLSLYVSSIDRILRLNNDLLKEGIRLAAACDGCSEDDIIDALGAILCGAAPRKGMAIRAVHVLEALVARIQDGSTAGDRVRIDKTALPVLDFLNSWFCLPANPQQEQPGGAPAIIAQVLTQLEEQALSNSGITEEPAVVLWTTYHSKKQAALFAEKVKFLKIADECHFSAEPIRQVGRSDHPELRNYPLEFAAGARFELVHSDGRTWAMTAKRSDRVIAIASEYRFYDVSSGDVKAGPAPRSIPRHILAEDPWLGPACVAEVAQAYRYWILGGLHIVSDRAAQASLEGDLAKIPPGVTIHVEIAGPQISPWFQQVLRKYVNSVGVNIDDLAGLVRCVAANEPGPGAPPPSSLAPGLKDEYLLRLALWLACALGQERVYIHGLALDYVVRRDATDEMMNREVYADLLAKTAVVNRARAVSVAARPAALYGLPLSNLVAFIDVCAQRAFPVASWATLESLSEFEAILDCGWFDEVFVWQERSVPFRVAVVPVGLFRLDPRNLLFVGAGDTSSAVSFVFGCFTTAATKRQP
jgi:ADP-dependent phosphofructokinase/glucokinase